MASGGGGNYQCFCSSWTDKVAKLIDGLLRSAYLSREALISGINVGLRGMEGSQIVVSVIICLHVAREEEDANAQGFFIFF